MIDDRYDVVVVGGGNAGFCAAPATAGRSRRVLPLEKGAPDEAGGNSHHPAGAFRVAHAGLPDLTGILDHDDRHAATMLPAYPPEAFVADPKRVTEGRADPRPAGPPATESRAALGWLRALWPRADSTWVDGPSRAGAGTAGVVSDFRKHTSARYGGESRGSPVVWRSRSSTRRSVRCCAAAGLLA